MALDFHGNLKNLRCIGCGNKERIKDLDFSVLPPKYEKCGGIIKPDIVFFGENISPEIYKNSFEIAERVNVLIVVGTTREVMPASLIPFYVKENGEVIIEIKVKESNYTNHITDIVLQSKASEKSTSLVDALKHDI